jgi:amino acid transporter
LHGTSCAARFAALRLVGYKTTLDKADAPLNIPAQLLGMRFLIVTLFLGMMIGSFGAVSACVNSSARVLYSMSRGGIVHSMAGSAHRAFGTPYVAVTVVGVVCFIIAAAVPFVPGNDGSKQEEHSA